MLNSIGNSVAIGERNILDVALNEYQIRSTADGIVYACGWCECIIIQCLLHGNTDTPLISKLNYDDTISITFLKYEYDVYDDYVARLEWGVWVLAV